MLNNLMVSIESRPKNFGLMKNASTCEKITGPCGDTVEVWLRIDGGKIRKATFMTDGCGYSVACCSAAAKLSEGLSPAQAAELTQEAILSAVGPIPEDHQHCALLAATAIQSAALDYRKPPPKPSFIEKLKLLFKPHITEKKHA